MGIQQSRMAITDYDSSFLPLVLLIVDQAQGY